MKLYKTLMATALLAVVASSCQKEKPGVATENTPSVQVPQPPPPGGPTGIGTPVSFVDHGAIDPSFIGTYGFVDFTPNLWDHYKLVFNNVTMQWEVVIGYYYKGILMYDGSGNLVDPLGGAVLSVRQMIDCDDTRELSEIFNSPTASTVVLGVTPAVTTTETVWWHDATTWYNSAGRVKSISFPKAEGTRCYILKVEINGHTYYQKIVV